MHHTHRERARTRVRRRCGRVAGMAESGRCAQRPVTEPMFHRSALQRPRGDETKSAAILAAVQRHVRIAGSVAQCEDLGLVVPQLVEREQIKAAQRGEAQQRPYRQVRSSFCRGLLHVPHEQPDALTALVAAAVRSKWSCAANAGIYHRRHSIAGRRRWWQWCRLRCIAQRGLLLCTSEERGDLVGARNVTRGELDRDTQHRVERSRERH